MRTKTLSLILSAAASLSTAMLAPQVAAAPPQLSMTPLVTAQNSPDALQALMDEGIALINTGRFQEALAAFEPVVAQVPNYAPAQVGKGYALYQLERYDEAIATLTRATELDSTHEYAWIWLGIALDDSGQPEAALRAYDEAIALNAENDDVWFHQGITLSRLERYAESLAAYSKAVDLNPSFERAWLNRGRVAGQLGQLEVALDSFDDLRPGDIVNKHNVHALLFVKFLDAEKKSFLAYETGSPPTAA